jgi:hypothetical protein
MTGNKGRNPTGRLIETVTSVLIAVVTVLTAAVVWRASVSSDGATGADRQGIINTLKAAAAKAENLAYLYQQEADLAQSHVLLQAQIDYLRGRADEIAAGEKGSAEAAILNSEADALLIADQGTVANTPLAANTRYRLEDGTFDFDARLRDIAAENPDLAALDPGQDFAQANRLDDKALFLALTVIIFALALFALTLAQITKSRIRLLFLGAGVIMTAVALLAVAGLELFSRLVA